MKILNIFLIAIFTSSSVFSIENKIYTPFGMSHRQPPRASTITLIEAKMSVSAKQVCGYTDWSTMQIKLPMHLLSKNYWEGKLNALKDEAIKAVLNMVGALPGMIVCNVSPTFCSIYNQSELMAGFEGRLTMDTCKMLEGVQNQDFLQSTPLKECIQKKMQSNTGKLTDTGNLSAGQAREECIFEAGNNSTLEQKMDKIGSHVGPKMFNVKKFITSLFPNNFDDQVKEYKNDHAVSGRTFSRNRKNYNFATTLFSGIELAGSSFVEKAGTFQPSVETLQAKEAEENEKK